MLKPYDMSGVIITGPKSLQEKVIKELYNLKVLHIVDHSKGDLADIGAPLESASRLSEILVKIRAIISALGIKKEEIKFELKNDLLEIESATRKLNLELNQNLEELRKIEESISKNESARKDIEVLRNFDVPFEYFTAYKSLIYFIGSIKGNALSLKEELSKSTRKFLLFDSETKKRNYIVLFIDAKSREKALDVLQKNNFLAINFVNSGNLKGTAADNFKKIEGELGKLQKKKKDIKRRIENLGITCKNFLIAADAFLSEQLEKAEAPLKFAATETSFLIKGWVPYQDLHKSIDILNKATRNKIFVHFEPAKKQDKVPVKLNNPKIAKPFEFFLDLYSIPTYREIDPTFFVFITFPIFFGIMLGDIGYGLISLIFFWILKRRMPKVGNLLNVLVIASFVSIVFGFIFAEFFGFEIYHPAVSREHEMFMLMYIAIAIGIVHVNLGLIIGFLNEWKSHGLVHAIYAKASWITLEIGFALLVLSSLDKILIAPWVGATFLGASILMLIKSEGFRGIIEIPTIFANIVSYIRLAAIGLTSVILALIINGAATEFFHKGSFYFLAGVLVLTIGHIINILIAWLGSFLHSLRLHYVEFFSKFFYGGAKKYHPFGIKDE